MTNTQLLTKFFEAENKRDWAAYEGYLHPQVMWFVHNEDSHLPIAGRQDYMDYVLTDYNNSPEITFECERMVTTASGNRVFAYLRYSNGSHSVTIFDYEEGLIKWKHEFILN